MAGTYEIPTEGSPNSSEDPKIKTMLKGLNEKLNSSNLLEDTGLASPNNSAYRVLSVSQQWFTAEREAGTYFMSPSAPSFTPPLSGANLTLAVPYFFFAKADYEVAGKTQKLRVRAQAAVNATKPAQTFTVGLYPITVAGGASELKITLGTAVTGSTIALVEPVASTITSKETADFTIPADGAYTFGVVSSGKLTVSSSLLLSAQLQTRSV